jgi:inorganic pyrophosphatase
VEITHTYGRDEALEVIKLSNEDYLDVYGDINKRFKEALSAVVSES